MGTPVKVAVAGALGRMGEAVAAAVEWREEMQLVARFDKPDAAAPGLNARDAALDAADVVIDFTTAEASAELATLCAERGGPALVIGSTGFTPAQIEIIGKAAERIPIVRSGNFSLGVNLLVGMVGIAARTLAADAYDVEVFEAHHRRKVDAPSGTALMLGEAAATARGVRLAEVARYAREGMTGARPTGEIGFSVMRAGGIVGEHSVTFASDEEILALSHSARDRSLFARGAVAAAAWIAGKPPGAYDMQDVLGFKG